MLGIEPGAAVNLSIEFYSRNIVKSALVRPKEGVRPLVLETKLNFSIATNHFKCNFGFFNMNHLIDTNK